MAKIFKVDLNSGHTFINPVKTSRNSSSTNPFKYQDFEGNAIDPLVCADVLVSFKSKPSRLKMITSSVAGSMTKLRSSITEPIKNFVNRIKVGVSNVWEYSKNTNLSDLPGIKQINSVMKMDITDIGKGMTDSISNIGKTLSGKMSILNTDITDLGKGISTTWSELIGKIHTNKINSETSVDELRKMWEAEIALAKEVA